MYPEPVIQLSHVYYAFSERLFAYPWTDLERQVINVSGLKAGAQRRIQRVALKLGDRKSQSDDSKVLTHTDNLPAVQLLFSVFLPYTQQSVTLLIQFNVS